MKYLILLISALAVFAFGRYSAPDKVKIETKYVEVEKKSEKTDTDRDKHKETTTTVVKAKDGSTTTTTKVVEDTKTDRKTSEHDDTSVSQSTSKEITKGSKVTVSALAGINLSDLTGGPDFGMSVSRPILGPITVGVFGFKSGVVGSSLGLTF